MVPDVRPPAAMALFGDALPAAERYADLLTGPGVGRGLVGPAEAGRIWDRHLLNCAVVAELVPERCVLADLGSGAGLPGIVLALLRPEADIILVESMARRIAFLTECVAALELTRVRVVRGRAEDLAGEISADIVTARAVAPLGKLAGWAVGLCRPGGTVLAIKGANAQTEVTESRTLLRQLGISDLAVLQVGSDKVDLPATVVRFTAPGPRGRTGGRTTVRASRRAVGRHGDRRLSGPRKTAAPRSSGHSSEPEQRRADD
jgi:16S rRNA (guanine527-N7)-methyltransferase